MKKSSATKLKEARVRFNCDQQVAAYSQSGQLVQLTRSGVAKMFGVSFSDVKFEDVLKNGGFTLA